MLLPRQPILPVAGLKTHVSCYGFPLPIITASATDRDSGARRASFHQPHISRRIGHDVFGTLYCRFEPHASYITTENLPARWW